MVAPLYLKKMLNGVGSIVCGVMLQTGDALLKSPLFFYEALVHCSDVSLHVQPIRHSGAGSLPLIETTALFGTQ
jgi:hypothetical protein